MNDTSLFRPPCEKPQPAWLSISRLTPSQLYISAEKLRQVRTWFRTDLAGMEPVPVKKLAGRLLLTDGHTRACAAWLAGCKQIPCVWDRDDMDWAAYAADINMCAEEGITSIPALAERIVSAEDYRHLWQDRCDAMYDTWYYKVLRQEKETIYFTNTSVQTVDFDIRPADIGVDTGEYYRLYANGIPAALGCIEKYSFAFWEAADIHVNPAFRGKRYGTAVTAYLTNRILAAGKTATCRTLPENLPMRAIIQKCGYEPLYT